MSEGRTGAFEGDESVREVFFSRFGREMASGGAPGSDFRSFSRTRPRLSGGQPVHQEPEHALVRAGAGKAYFDGAGISGDHGPDLEQPKAKGG